MKKWNLIVDVANCTNCNLCTIAVQDEHEGNAFAGYAEEMPKHGHRWIEIERRERGTPLVTDVAYLPTMCQHCDNAPCIAAAPDAIAKRDDGIVLIDPVKSKGRKDIVDAGVRTQVDRVIQNDYSCRAEHRTGGGQRIEIHRQVDLIGSEHRR